MIFNQRSLLYCMLLLTGVRAHEEINSAITLENDGYIIHDMTDDEMLEAAMTAAEGSDPPFLRGRELQSSNTCRATNPYTKTVCGMLPPLPDDTSCLNSQATCAGLQYPCTCSGETSCSYCTVRTPGAIVCQVTGTSMTFSDTESKLTTCRCTYIGNGQVFPDCFHPTPQPIPLPTFWPEYVTSGGSSTSNTVNSPSAPTPTRAPVSYTYVTGPTPSVPVSYTPVVFHYNTGTPVSTYYRAPTPAPVIRTTTQGGGGGAAAQQARNNNKDKNKKVM